MAKSTTPTLACTQCGYENEPERVYCHNCGTKLDRSVLPKESEVRRESPEKAQRRIRKMTNPGSKVITRELGALAKAIFWALVVACLIQIAREPDGVPSNDNQLALRLVSGEMSDLIDSPQPRALAFTDAEINSTLKQAVKGKQTDIPGVAFDRAFVNFLPGVARVTVQQSVWGYPLYSSMGIRPLYKDGVFTPVIVSGSVGRLPVDPKIMEYVSYAFPFRKLWNGMKREREQILKLREIRVDQGRVILISRGTTAATPAGAAAAAPATAAPPR